MSDAARHAGKTGPSHRWTEVGVALVMALFGLITIIGSLRAGIGWGAEGPKSGFFPFYIGVIIIIASAVNLMQAFVEHDSRLFAEWAQLRQVLAMVVPTAVYVVAIPYAGIYLSSAALIALFMSWLGRYRWPLTAVISLGVPLALFFMFEKWFLVPLPKGPIEEWLGF